MRRAVPVITATLGGLALLASFHTTPSATAIVAPAPVPVSSSQALAPAARPPAGAGPNGPTTTTVAGPERSVDGPVAYTRFGEVQVNVKVAGSRLVDVQALRLPFDRQRSRRISEYAGPRLRIEALRAQSANIDLVSGASYTTDGYAESLQGALDRAGL